MDGKLRCYPFVVRIVLGLHGRYPVAAQYLLHISTSLGHEDIALHGQDLGACIVIQGIGSVSIFHKACICIGLYMGVSQILCTANACALVNTSFVCVYMLYPVACCSTGHNVTCSPWCGCTGYHTVSVFVFLYFDGVPICKF